MDFTCLKCSWTVSQLFHCVVISKNAPCEMVPNPLLSAPQLVFSRDSICTTELVPVDAVSIKAVLLKIPSKLTSIKVN